MDDARPLPQLPAELLRACYAEAVRCYPSEACGLLLGPADRPVCDEVRLCQNQQDRLHAQDPVAYPRTSRTAYSLPAHEVLFLERSLGSERPVKIVFHSHIDVGAYFSDEDRRAATWQGEPLYPVDHLVLDAGPEGVRGARLYRFRDGDFVEVARYDAEGARCEP
ncbi:MAG: Mov34/MPN/PAD-1 family protein [Myxococcales bacterium]|nr:Mov34/MPN/PAD-1 family protein [Myxococcota bacterium]MDW8284442.1 Mov34/MPN/PAD-1 family protein [Myxococcales bacterium]